MLPVFKAQTTALRVKGGRQCEDLHRCRLGTLRCRMETSGYQLVHSTTTSVPRSDGSTRNEPPPKTAHVIELLRVKICSVKWCYQPLPFTYTNKTCPRCSDRSRRSSATAAATTAGKKRKRPNRGEMSGIKREDGDTCSADESDGDVERCVKLRRELLDAAKSGDLMKVHQLIEDGVHIHKD